MSYQRAYIPTKKIYLSQGYGKDSSTHKNSYALDLAGTYNVFAPFDCKVTKLYVQKGHSYEVWLTSTKKVLCANGYYDYMTVSFTHPKNIDKLKVGQKFKQFDYVCSTTQMTGTSTGNHLHLELSRGKKAGWKIVNGDYVNVNNVKPEEFMFITEDTIIEKDTYRNKKYRFIKESDITYKVTGTDGSLWMRKTPKVSIFNKIKTIPEGAEVIRFYAENGWAYTYRYSDLGYVDDRYLKKGV